MRLSSKPSPDLRWAKRLLEEDRKVRFITSRVLWRTGIGRGIGLTIQPEGCPKLSFYRSSVAATLWLDPAFFHEDQKLLQELLKPGDTYVDVGANIGILALTASQCVEAGGRVIAIEPHPRTYKHLRETLQKAPSKIRAHRVAAGAAPGLASITDQYLDDQNHLVPRGRGLPVEVMTLDALLADVGDIDLLKIDTEGAELAVLQGAANVLERTRAVLFEANVGNSARFGVEVMDIARLFAQFGFKIVGLKDSIRVLPENQIAHHNGNLLAIR